MLEVDEGVVGPELLLQVFAGDQFARPAHEGGEDPKRLLRQENAVAAVSNKLARSQDPE